MQAQDLESIFHLPLTQEAYHELQDMNTYLQDTLYDENSRDRWILAWGNDRNTSKQFYTLVFKGLDAPPTFSSLWKANCIPRIKFFGWLLLMDRLNTRDMLQQRNFNVQPGVTCVLCDHDLRETRDHLSFECEFARQCWSLLYIVWSTNPRLHDRIMVAKQVSTNGFFMDIILIAAWEIWKLRNAIIFNVEQRSMQIWKLRVKVQFHLQS